MASKSNLRNFILNNLLLKAIFFENKQKNEKSKEKAFYYYKSAADYGHPIAQLNVGNRYSFGLGTKKSYKEAVRYYTLAAGSNIPNAEDYSAMANYNLGMCYTEGLGVKRSDELAFQHFKTAADQGNVDAQLEVGNRYKKAVGISQSFEESFRYYRMAAEQNIPGQNSPSTLAFYYLGICYENGEGIEKSESNAIYYYKLAAKQGLLEAQFDMGVKCEASPEFSTKDTFYYYHLAALNNEVTNPKNAIANYKLAVFYSQGFGVEKSAKKAFQYFQKAANQKYEKAISRLAECYEQGIGVTQSFELAAQNYAKAAKLGMSENYHRAALCYNKLGDKYREECYENLRSYYNLENQNTFFQLDKIHDFLKLTRKLYNLIDVKDFFYQINTRIRELEIGDLDDCAKKWIILGDKYRFGLGIPISNNQAFRCYQHAAQLGNGYAELLLGYCFDFAIGVEQSFEKAFYHYQKACNQKIIESYRYLSFAYSRITEDASAYQKASDLIDKYYLYRTSQSNYGNLNATLILACQQLLGDYFFLSEIHEQSSEKAFKYFSLLADSNDWLGLQLVGISYIQHWGVRQSLEHAVHYLTLAASHPDADEGCLYILAKLLLAEKMDEYIVTAEDFLNRIVTSNEIPQNLLGQAAFLLGNLYQENKDTLERIEYYYELAISCGNKEAMIAMAKLLENKLDIQLSSNQEKIFQFYKKVCDSGDYKYLVKLGFLYENGLGVQKSEKKTFECYKKAAEKKLNEGMFNLARCYEEGIGVKKSLLIAVKYYHLSAIHGYFEGYYREGICYQQLGEDFREERDECFMKYHKGPLSRWIFE